jgi:hypothetical protein
MISSLDEKVFAIFSEMAGERAKQLDASVMAEPAMSTIGNAFIGDYDRETAAAIGLHMADWNSDSAFIVAVHLFPERFTPEEIREGVMRFLYHAPNHIREACRITGTFVWSDFPDADSTGPPE